MVNIRRRKKAIQKVVKLLNLATSTNSGESQMALRHAESVIQQNAIRRNEIPLASLCDIATLNKVAWAGQSRLSPAPVSVRQKIAYSYVERRFSEKPTDPDKLYAECKTILDDFDATPQRPHHDDEEGIKDMTINMTDESKDDNRVDRNLSEASNKSDESLTSTAFKQHDGHTYTTGYSSDNVIDAAKAFRPDSTFTERLRDQYASSDPDIPFEQDHYWKKVYDQLVDFDEVGAQNKLESLEQQKVLAAELLQQKRQQRLQAEQEEQIERTERAKIEQCFEEAIERAFQARARAYEAWEKDRTTIRMNCLKAEQEAQLGFEELVEDTEKVSTHYKTHLLRKEEYRAAKIMHELRRHLALSVRPGEEGGHSFDKVIAIMEANQLSLRDLEFSDIQNKSLFIRLLEKETAKIADVVLRERYTEEMLAKFLSANAGDKRHFNRVDNPIKQIETLLVQASAGGQFEAQKGVEQVIHLMSSYSISIKDVNLACITKYSIFVRLLNWEAEQIVSIPERERFTAGILESYVASSIGHGGTKQSSNKKSSF